MIKAGLGLFLENEIRKFKGKNGFGYEIHGEAKEGAEILEFTYPTNLPVSNLYGRIYAKINKRTKHIRKSSAQLL